MLKYNRKVLPGSKWLKHKGVNVTELNSLVCPQRCAARHIPEMLHSFWFFGQGFFFTGNICA